MFNAIIRLIKARESKSKNSKYINGIGYAFHKIYVDRDSILSVSIELEEMLLKEQSKSDKLRHNPYLEGMALAVTILSNLDERCRRKEDKLNAIRFLSEPTEVDTTESN